MTAVMIRPSLDCCVKSEVAPRVSQSVDELGCTRGMAYRQTEIDQRLVVDSSPAGCILSRNDVRRVAFLCLMDRDNQPLDTTAI
jgi:hypothetical protein